MADFLEKTVSGARTGAQDVWTATSKARGSVIIATLALAGLSALSIAKMISPTGVAENSDGFILNETLKTSLAKSRQDNEALKRAKKLESMRSGARLPHDKFV